MAVAMSIAVGFCALRQTRIPGWCDRGGACRWLEPRVSKALKTCRRSRTHGLASHVGRAASLPADTIRRAGGAAHENAARLRCARLSRGARIGAYRSFTGLRKGAAAIRAPACGDAKIGASTEIGSAASARAIPALRRAIGCRVRAASSVDGATVLGVSARAIPALRRAIGCRVRAASSVDGPTVLDGGPERATTGRRIGTESAERTLATKTVRFAREGAGASLQAQRRGLRLKAPCRRRVDRAIAA
jgi:hypothetical protein